MDPTTIHYHKADVVYPASVYLLNPVRVVLSIHQPNLVQCVSETTTDNTRTAMLYYRVPDRVDLSHKFAVLEFKQRGIQIRYQDRHNRLSARIFEGGYRRPKAIYLLQE